MLKQTKYMTDLVNINRISRGDKYFTKEWIDKMLQNAEDVKERAYFLYHLSTGLRVSDVCGTRLEHMRFDEGKTYTYDFKKREWRWVFWDKKIKGDLTQWLKVRQHLKLDKEQSQLLFPFSTRTADRIIKALAKRAGHPKATLCSTHWCRHTYIRLSRFAGRDMKAIQQNTGDTIKTIMEHYAEFSSEDMAREMNEKGFL